MRAGSVLLVLENLLKLLERVQWEVRHVGLLGIVPWVLQTLFIYLIIEEIPCCCKNGFSERNNTARHSVNYKWINGLQ